jgi:hypothetical protein
VKEKIKTILLEKYLDFNLKSRRKDENLYVFSEKLKSIKQILVIKPVAGIDDKSLQNFIAGLYAVYPNVQVSTFLRSSLRGSDTNWLGVPNDRYLKNIQEIHFDLVIDLNLQHDTICSYICKLSGAPLRLNLKPGHYDNIYNLYIKSGNSISIDNELQNILKYLRTFSR